MAEDPVRIFVIGMMIAVRPRIGAVSSWRPATGRMVRSQSRLRFRTTKPMTAFQNSMETHGVFSAKSTIITVSMVVSPPIRQTAVIARMSSAWW